MADESTILDYSDVLSDISSNVSDLASSLVVGDGSTTLAEIVESINEQLSNIVLILDTNGTTSDIASTVLLDSTQFNQLMTLETAQLVVLLFILGFIMLFFGVFLARLLTSGWRI